MGHHNWKIDYETDSEKHPENYDKLVKRRLRDIECQIAKKGRKICEESKESGRKVIDEMDRCSKEIAKKVKGWDLYFVSEMACSFASKYRK